jgi:hypothetical protein
MATISTTDARGLFTKKLIDVYKERTAPTAFLRSFFTVKEEVTKELSIEVQRGTEKIAVDVERGTEGNRNQFTRSTEKIFIPPFYREYFDATQLSLYDRLFGSEAIDAGIFNAFLEQVADKLRMLQDKIERSYELQCSQVLETGIVTLNAATNIDFKRKTASKVDLGAGNYWAAANVDPSTSIEAGCNFLRQVGKAQGGTYNMIMGSSALVDLISNEKIQKRADIKNFSLDSVLAPQRNSVGASLHGQISAGSYRVNLWAYPEFYDNTSGVSTPYVNPKKAILLPEAPKFVLGFAAVPQLVTELGARKGAYIISDYKDERNASHIFDIKSAGVAIPTAVDQIYTMQVVAS